MGIACYSGYVNKNKSVWIPSAEINSVFLLDSNKEVNWAFSYDMSDEKECGIIKICEIEDILYCFERNQYKYWKYDKHTQRVNGYLFSDINHYITSAVIENENVWLFPSEFNCPIIIVSLTDETVTEIQWNDDKEFNKKLIGTSMIKSYYFKGDIYLANRNENNIYLIEINCFTRNIKYKKIDDVKRINAVAASEQYVYILCLNSSDRTVIRKYDKKEYLIDEEIDVSEYIRIHNINPIEYGRMIYFENSLLIFSIKEDVVTIVEDMKIISDLKDCEGMILKRSCYDYQVIDDMCYIFSLDNNGFCKIFKKNNGLVGVNESININEEYYVNVLKEQQSKGITFIETNNVKLPFFINSLL